MIDLSISYLGLKLKNPLIVGSTGLTNSVENLVEIEKQGAGAVVLKSLFEEQIHNAASHTIMQDEYLNLYPEAEDYIRNYSKENDLNIYLNLVSEAKKRLTIPVIASINCITISEWVEFAKKIENAGADALELNVAVLPSDPERDGSTIEKIYFDIAKKITSAVNIPVSLKLSYYFSGLAKTMISLSWTGIKGLVLFNRFYSPDFDIENLELKSSFVFSSPSDLGISLRWVAMLSPYLKCDVAASTGVHYGVAFVKQLLAGANAVQVASVLYKKGFKEIGIILEYLENWMVRHNFSTIEEFRGKLSVKNVDNPAAFERIQFMKYFSGID
jgi:dihydroorotate dehydrogenase (fumarate)